MSMVKLKNTVVKAARAALQARLGRVVTVTGKLEGSRISIYLGPIGAPIYPPTCYEFFDGGAVFKIMLGQEVRSPAALEAIACAKEAAAQTIQAAGYSGGAYVGFENWADDEQKEALRDHWKRTGEQPKAGA